MGLESEIIDLVALQLGIRKVAREDRFMEDLGAESVDLVNIIASAEEQFGVVIDEENWAGLSKVSDLVNHIQQTGCS